jgi:DNA-binding NarL/FixJ family response regulator
VTRRPTDGSHSRRAREALEAERSKLAPREVEALGHIARGLTHAQAAKRMGVRESTVDTYVKRVRAKLNLGNKAELTRKAIELSVVPRPAAGEERRPPGPPDERPSSRRRDGSHGAAG